MPAAPQIASDARWFKSSYSGGNATECVEAAYAPAEVLVRDSKRPTGPYLVVATEAWAWFIADTRRLAMASGQLP